MDPTVKLEEFASSYSCGMGSESVCYKVRRCILWENGGTWRHMAAISE